MRGLVGNGSSGDFIVSGQNWFGSREHAAIVIKMNGIQAVLAKSFARSLSNRFNTGLLAIICDTDCFMEGDEIEPFSDEGKIINLTRNERLSSPSLPLR
jgi:3-isopropylmalate/(R)-2-methylmalate dehydratase small subunit